MGDGKQDTFLLLHRLEVPKLLSVLLAYLLIVITLNFQVVAHLTTHFLGGAERDAGLYIWLSDLNSDSFFERPWFSTPAFYPYGKSLAWSDNFLLPSALIWFLKQVGFNLAASYNLVLLGVFVLNGFLTFLFVHSFSRSLLPSFFSGAAFMSLSFLRGHLGHPQLQFVFWIPLFLLLLFRFIAWGKRKDIFASGLVIVGAFLSCVYYALFLILAGVLVLTALLLLRPHLLKETIRWKYGATGFLALPLLLPFLMPYVEVKEAFGSRFLHEAAAFSASAFSYIAAPPFNWLYGNTSGLSHAEAQLLPGIVVLMLSMCAVMRLAPVQSLRPQAFLWIGMLIFISLMSISPVEEALGKSAAHYLCALSGWASLGLSIIYLHRFGKMEKALGMTVVTNRALIGIFCFAALVCYLISLGPRGFPEEGIIGLGVHRFFFNSLPGFDAVRAIGRVGVLTDFFLIALAAIALAHFSKLIGYPRLLGSLAIFVVFVENHHVRYPLEELPRKPSIFSRLEELENSNKAFIVLPFAGEIDGAGRIKSWGEFSRLQVNYMNWSRGVSFPMVNGYSGQRTRLMTYLASKLSRFPDLPSIKALAEIAGLNYLVFIPSLSSSPDAFRMEQRIAAFPESLRLKEKDSEGNLLIEYIGSRTLDVDGAYLLSPSSPPGELILELSAVLQYGQPKITLLPTVEGAEKKIALAPLHIPASNTWTRFTLPLPRGEQSVPPYKLQIWPEPGSAPPRSLTLRASEFSPY